MELLDGLSSMELINNTAVNPRPASSTFCAGLRLARRAHGRGRPSRHQPHNIFLTRRGDIPDFVKVLDFGLVKARNLAGQVS